MTNAHVVEGADEVIVTLTDKREFKAKIDRRRQAHRRRGGARSRPPACRRCGSATSAKLKVGEWVIAIGSPFGLENTVTAGIVSAKARDTGDYLPFIQTDVAINPGNSGGPLINMRGEVVGINSQIYSRSGGFMGISFAIPIDEAMRVAEQLRAGGRVIRGRIGVRIDQVTKDVAESIGLGKPMGALVRSVEAGGPAEKAGVEAGDIITKFDGRTSRARRPAAHRRQHQAGQQGQRCRCSAAAATATCRVTVAEFEPEKVAAKRPAEREGAKPAPPVGALGLARRRPHRRAEARAEAARRRAGRGGRGRCRPGRAARGRRDRQRRQHRGRPSVKQFDAAVAKLDKAQGGHRCWCVGARWPTT